MLGFSALHHVGESRVGTSRVCRRGRDRLSAPFVISKNSVVLTAGMAAVGARAGRAKRRTVRCRAQPQNLVDLTAWACQEVKTELEKSNMKVTGVLPAWLQGHAVWVGAAKWEYGTKKFNTFLDGSAMLYDVHIEDGAVEFSNRFLDTENRRRHQEANTIAVRENFSRPCLDTIWDRLSHAAQNVKWSSENSNAFPFPLGGGRFAVTADGAKIMEVSLDTLSTIGPVQSFEELNVMFHSEPSVDPRTKEWFMLCFGGRHGEYMVVRTGLAIPPKMGGPLQHEVISRFEAQPFIHVHSILMTPSYVVVVQPSRSMNALGLAKAEASWLLTGHYDHVAPWLFEPTQKTTIRLIDRATGHHAAVLETDPITFNHVVNSFEQMEGPDEHRVVYADIVCHDEHTTAGEYGFLTAPMDSILSGQDAAAKLPTGGHIRRFRMDLDDLECSWEAWDTVSESPLEVESVVIHPSFAGLKHQFSYCIRFLEGTQQVVKLDHETKRVVTWAGQGPREIPHSLIFAPGPSGSEEDGAVMALIREERSQETSCVVLDASSMQEVARFHVPAGQHVPYVNHGAWEPNLE